MRLSATRLGVLFSASVLMTGAAGAQVRPAPAAPPLGVPQADQMRGQLVVMERLLERAVGEGIFATRAQMPDMFSLPLISGNNRVRGFRVENYGVFFDVEVPGLPQSIAWSLRVIARNNDAVILRELNDLRTFVGRAVTDEKDRAEAQRRIAFLESRVSGTNGRLQEQAGPGQPRAVASRPGESGAPVIQHLEVQDPDLVYVGEVKNSLINAILDSGITLPLAADEWLTVAARASDDTDNQTLSLTIKGQDLLALRTGQISRDEARKRIRESRF